MIISIDIDGTWSKDPSAWLAFATMFESLGHQVIITTNRRCWSEDMERLRINPLMPVIYADRQLKRRAAEEAGFLVDVWIDDMPGTIEETLYLKPPLDNEL